MRPVQYLAHQLGRQRAGKFQCPAQWRFLVAQQSDADFAPRCPLLMMADSSNECRWRISVHQSFDDCRLCQAGIFQRSVNHPRLGIYQ